MKPRLLWEEWLKLVPNQVKENLLEASRRQLRELEA